MKGLFIITLVHFGFFCSGQTVMTADKTNVLIGDQIKATITTNLSEGREWRNLEHVWPDSIPGIEVVRGPEIDDKNPASVRYTWHISVFDTGWIMIPALPVVIRKENDLDTFFTTEIPVQVKSIEPDSTGLVGIKDIERQPFSVIYYKKYLPHFLILILILTGLYFWWRKRNKKLEIVEIPIPEPFPHEWAFKALDELEQKRLWQSGEVKEHYSLLTGILREYLERRYNINALEQTTDEILQQLSQQQLSPELMNDIEQLLSIADLIKFAKADPGIDIHAETIRRVRRFVTETMDTSPPVDTTVHLTPSDETVE